MFFQDFVPPMPAGVDVEEYFSNGQDPINSAVPRIKSIGGTVQYLLVVFHWQNHSTYIFNKPANSFWARAAGATPSNMFSLNPDVASPNVALAKPRIDPITWTIKRATSADNNTQARTLGHPVQCAGLGLAPGAPSDLRCADNIAARHRAG
jgi:hypothetical protein